MGAFLWEVGRQLAWHMECGSPECRQIVTCCHALLMESRALCGAYVPHELHMRGHRLAHLGARRRRVCGCRRVGFAVDYISRGELHWPKWARWVHPAEYLYNPRWLSYAAAWGVPLVQSAEHVRVHLVLMAACMPSLSGGVVATWVDDLAMVLGGASSRDLAMKYRVELIGIDERYR